MLFSLAVIFLTGLSLSYLLKKFKMPPLIGLLITGIVLGPYFLNLIDKSILNISAELRKIALIIILIRAGLNLDIEALKKSGLSAVLMCFVPATLELIGTIIFAPLLLNITVLEATMLGAVLAAVSPAVVVPKMLKLQEEGWGKDKGIPQLVMAGASVDDIFVIVIFTSLLELNKSGTLNVLNFIQIPTSIILGLGFGLLIGYFLSLFFKTYHMRDSIKVIILLSFSFLLVSAEPLFTGAIGFSGLLATMSLAIPLQFIKKETARRLSLKFSKLWVAAEIILFVLVGAAVNISYIADIGLKAVLLLLLALIFRIFGVIISVSFSKLNNKEKLFCAFSYIPKATVQAAIGSIPLAEGLACGNIILSISVLAILITAPLGAILIDVSYSRFLSIKES